MTFIHIVSAVCIFAALFYLSLLGAIATVGDLRAAWKSFVRSAADFAIAMAAVCLYHEYYLFVQRTHSLLGRTFYIGSFGIAWLFALAVYCGWRACRESRREHLPLGKRAL